jgi:hypothetical protein
MRRGTAFLALSCCLLTLGMTGCTSSSRSAKSGMEAQQKELTEAQRRQLRQFTPEDEKRRARASKEFEGLTVGEVEDMPPVPPLPEEFGRDASQDQLQAHSYLVAREEVANGYAPWVSVPARQRYLLSVWSQRLEDRKQRLAIVAQERASLHEAITRNAVSASQWRRQNREIQERYDEMIRRERLQLYQALTDAERFELAR